MLVTYHVWCGQEDAGIGGEHIGTGTPAILDIIVYNVPQHWENLYSPPNTGQDVLVLPCYGSLRETDTDTHSLSLFTFLQVKNEYAKVPGDT